MKRRSTLSSGIGMALQKRDDNPDANKIVDSCIDAPLSPSHYRSQSVTDDRTFDPLRTGVEGRFWQR